MSQLTTVVASRMYAKQRRKLRKTISNRTIFATLSILSKRYGLLPCFCDHDPLRMMKRCQTSALSKSSNAFWHQNTKSKGQRNNSTASETRQANSSRSRNFQTFRKSIIQRFKRNKNRTITARSVIRKRTNPKQDHPPSNMMQTSIDQPLSNPSSSQHSSNDSDRFVSPDNSDENNTLEPTNSSFKLEQQNINATNNISQTIQQTSQMTINSSRKTPAIARKNTRNTSNRSTINASKRIKSKRTSKRKPNIKQITYRRSPFPNPNLFHSLPPLQDSDEITKTNVHDNHLCCKPITSCKGLSINDQKKLIEHNYLTLISLLPIYLTSPSNFSHEIREQMNISDSGAFELDRLMNEWGSARLFIGANSPYKTLTQTI